MSFGSAKNFYCCRFGVDEDLPFSFGSAKNFYCCRYLVHAVCAPPLEVLRISTVVDRTCPDGLSVPLEVLRISTVVDERTCLRRP